MMIHIDLKDFDFVENFKPIERGLHILKNSCSGYKKNINTHKNQRKLSLKDKVSKFFSAGNFNHLIISKATKSS